MAPFEITVRGTASIPHKAERSTLDVQIKHQGHDRSLVASETKTANVIEHAARIYTTTVPFKIEVQDFDALAGLISKLSTSIPHVYVKNIRWSLAESTLKAFECKLRRLAAVDAAKRAKDYASALDMSLVKPVYLKEDGYSGFPDRMYTGRAGSDDESEFDGIEFVPEEIRMEKEIEAKFEAE
ncbi:hypothetical protein BDV97DRAFT_402549 [Delphinella strobiligena]|nr:hypothetical protein BDV97DRAFT_402549 [Delphinella strobiligena]